MTGLNRMRNPKHLEFVLKYLETGEVEDSYISVYPSAKRSSAYTLGRRILRTEEARAVIESYILQNLDESKVLLNSKRIIEEMSSVAYGSKRLSQKVPALRALGDWAGLGEGLENLQIEQKRRFDESLKAFRATFDAESLVPNVVTVADLEDYLDIYGVKYSEELSKDELLELLKDTVRKHKKTQEYLDYRASQASGEIRDD